MLHVCVTSSNIQFYLKKSKLILDNISLQVTVRIQQQ